MRPVFGRPSEAADRPGRLPAIAGAGAAYRADGGDGASWSVRAASAVGVRHRLAGEDNDDAYAWSAGENRLVVAVADGVGSVVDASLAARAAADAACGAADPEDGWEAAMTAAAAAVRSAGGATTLVVAAVGTSGDVSLARVGDSTAFVLDAGTWHELWPAAEDSADGDIGPVSTRTDALPSTAVPSVVTARLTPGSALLLVTDGLADPLRDGPTTVAPAFAATLASPPAPLELLSMVDFSRQGCFDDRTVLGVWLTPV